MLIWLDYHWIPSKGKSGRMLSGINKERFDVENFETGEFVIIANVLDKKLHKNWAMTNVYGPAQNEFKEKFLIELSNFCHKSNYPLIIGGYFNI